MCYLPWCSYPEPAYGIYSDLWTNLKENDPCNDNFGTQIAFFDPGIWWPEFAADTPFCKGPGGIEDPCQDEMVVSPVIDLTRYSTGNDEVQDADIPAGDLSDLGGIILRYTMYGDLPFQNLVFASCFVRDVDPVTGCPGRWKWIHYTVYEYAEYCFMKYDIARFVESDRIQVALGVWDACGDMWEAYPNCLYHTPAPYYDNVRVQRYKQVGPQWSYRGLDLFQDNFPEDEYDVESFVRADAADDKAATTDPYFITGDSIVLTCDSPFGGGIRNGGVTGGGEVYLHVRCADISGWLGKPMLYGSALLLISHVMLALSPGHAAIAVLFMFVLGIAFSLVPASMWPSVALIVNEKRLGTGYGLMTSIQNFGLWAFPILAGFITGVANKSTPEGSPKDYTYTVLMFATLGLFGLMFAFFLKRADKTAGGRLERA